MTAAFYVTTAGEGPTDEAVMRRVVSHLRGAVARSHPCDGKRDLLRRLPGFNAAAARSPWFVLVDLDTDEPCAPPAVRDWLREPAAHMQFRVAVSEVEAWLLADRERVARFLGVGISAVPSDPESLSDPKEEFVNLARLSTKRAIRELVVPAPGSRRPVGPGYAGEVIRFVRSEWRPDVAADHADSLNRCLHRLSALRAAP